MSWTTVEALIERACNPILISADWSLNMQICDVLKSPSSRCIPQAVAAIKDNILLPDSDANMRGLELLEACVKNVVGVWPVVGSKDYLLTLKKRAMQRDVDMKVREKILELIVTWATAFKNRPDLQFGNIYSSMIKEGVSFPPPTDITSFDVPKPKPDPRSHPAYAGKKSSPGGAKLNIEVLQNNILLLREVFSFVDPETEDVSKNSLVIELLETLKGAQAEIMARISNASKESSLSSLIRLNDDLLEIQNTYSSLHEQHQQSRSRSAPVRTLNSMSGLESEPIPVLPPPKQTIPSSTNAPKVVEMDEFDLLARRTLQKPSPLEEKEVLPKISVPSRSTESTTPAPFFVPDFGLDSFGTRPTASYPVSGAVSFQNTSAQSVLPLPTLQSSNPFSLPAPGSFAPTFPIPSTTATSAFPWPSHPTPTTNHVPVPTYPASHAPGPSVHNKAPAPLEFDPFNLFSREQTKSGQAEAKPDGKPNLLLF